MRAFLFVLPLWMTACGSGANLTADAAPADAQDASRIEDAAVDTADAHASLPSQEGHACSTSPSDDPQLVCAVVPRLVCVSTYARVVTNPMEAAKYDGGLRPVFVCRAPCATDTDCPQSGDVCCPGTIHGPSWGATRACVPPSSCDTPPTSTDGGL
jgi:hypothetical protein